jgi:hypothetical protein
MRQAVNFETSFHRTDVLKQPTADRHSVTPIPGRRFEVEDSSSRSREKGGQEENVGAQERGQQYSLQLEFYQ